MDCNWLEGPQSIYQLSNPITLFEPLMFPHSDVLMKRNEAGSLAALGLLKKKKKTRVLTFSGPTWTQTHTIVFWKVSFMLPWGFHVCALFFFFAGDVRTTEDGAFVRAHIWVCVRSKRQDHSQTNNPPDPKSQRRTGPDNLTTFTTLSCTMQTVHFMNCRLYLNLVQHLSVICLDMQMSIWTRGFV